MVIKVVKEPAANIITWITDDVRAGLKYKGETNKGFQKQFKHNMRNKVEEPKANIGHSKGSISTTMWAMKLKGDSKIC